MSNQQQQPQQPQSQNYLFYSQNYCEHSKRIIQIVNKYGLSNKFILCNIDNQDLMIPPFITSVPTLYIASERQLLTDDKLFSWINIFVEKQFSQSKKLSMVEVTGSDDIFAFQQNELGSSNDIGYSFIDDSANDLMSTSFELLDGSNKDKLRIPGFTRIEGVTQDNQETSGTNTEKDIRKKQLDSAYDELMKSRQMENMSNPLQQRM